MLVKMLSMGIAGRRGTSIDVALDMLVLSQVKEEEKRREHTGWEGRCLWRLWLGAQIGDLVGKRDVKSLDLFRHVLRRKCWRRNIIWATNGKILFSPTRAGLMRHLAWS